MNKILLSLLSVAILGGTVFGVTHVAAQETIANPHDSIIQRLVQKFGLNESEVRTVFEEESANRRTEMTQRFEEKLTQAVTDGKLTEDQKQKILAKHEEMKNSREAEMESFKNMTEEERQTAMEAKHAELKAWAAENGVDREYLMGMKMGKLGGWHMKIAH